MDKCKHCLGEIKQEWYVPTSHGGIAGFCSKACADAYADRLIGEGRAIKGHMLSPNEMVIETGTNKS